MNIFTVATVPESPQEIIHSHSLQMDFKTVSMKFYIL